MRHLQGFKNMVSQIRWVRFARKLLDEVGQQIVLRVPVFPRGTRWEAQGTITKRLNLFIRRRSTRLYLCRSFPIRSPGDLRCG